MRFLFLKRSLSWPRASGHDVHTFHLAQALAQFGHEIDFAFVEAPSAQAIAGLPLAELHDLARRPASPDAVRLTRLQRRYLRFWGIDPVWLDATSAIVAGSRPDVVVAAGLDVLPCLAAASGAIRVWYAADEYARHQLTMLHAAKPASWRRLFDAAIAGVYERAYAPHIDRVWVVSAAERRWMRVVSGVGQVDVIPNGVDADYFRPGGEAKIPHSCTFWGRLDAGPNIQAMTWFCRRVWPSLRGQFPDARFTMYGFNPVAEVRELGGNGVEVVADAADIRSPVRMHEVVVLPFVSGGGIKNKLLEAAALGLPIVATPAACGGLNSRDDLPLIAARSPRQWLRSIRELWADAQLRHQLGDVARAWVVARHGWHAAAEAALAGLPASSHEGEKPRDRVGGVAAHLTPIPSPAEAVGEGGKHGQRSGAGAIGMTSGPCSREVQGDRSDVAEGAAT